MAQCDMCGSAQEQLVRAEVEGSVLVVCAKCAKYGKVLGRVRTEAPKAKLPAPAPKPEVHETIVPNYGPLIRAAREKSGMTQKDFARRISEKESILAKFETGRMEPPIDTARKLERLLKIKLVEQHTDSEMQMIQGMKGKNAGGLTIGDVLRL